MAPIQSLARLNQLVQILEKTADWLRTTTWGTLNLTDATTKFPPHARKTSRTQGTFLAYVASVSARIRRGSKKAATFAQYFDRKGLLRRLPSYSQLFPHKYFSMLSKQNCLVLLRSLPSPSRSNHFGDVSETNSQKLAWSTSPETQRPRRKMRLRS